MFNVLTGPVSQPSENFVGGCDRCSTNEPRDRSTARGLGGRHRKAPSAAGVIGSEESSPHASRQLGVPRDRAEIQVPASNRLDRRRMQSR